MKKLRGKLIIALCLVLLMPAILAGVALSLPAVYSESYYAELPELVRRADNAEGKKLILIGGSNVAFGTDTELLEELLAQEGYAYTVCPLGLYAAVGTSAMLSLSEKSLKKGDIVILAIEPNEGTMSTYFGATAFLKCSEKAKWMIPRLNKDQRSAVYGNYAGYLSERFSVVRSGELPQAEGAYAKSAFNEQGNMVYTREGNIMALGYDYGEMIDLGSLGLDGAFVSEINEYCELAASRGASVYMSFSPMNASAVTDRSEEVIRAYFSLMNHGFSCPVISDPHDYIMDSGWFYDSNFHLNSAGAEVRTVHLAEDILAQLGCYKALSYTLPEMPASQAQLPDNSADARYFSFEPLGEEGYLISGLTGEGLGETALTLPSSYEGKPVAAIQNSAFKGAEKLEELRIPETIGMIPDFAFEGCPNLSRVILEHTSRPADLSAHSLDGAPETLRFFVPASAYTFYRDGFGCESNPWTPWLDRVYTY